jgi:ABC-type uncharacterized transport system permease subunit
MLAAGFPYLLFGNHINNRSTRQSPAYGVQGKTFDSSSKTPLQNRAKYASNILLVMMIIHLNFRVLYLLRTGFGVRYDNLPTKIGLKIIENK